MNTPGFTDVFISLGLVVLAILISRFWKISVEKDMAIGSVRSFVQLVAVGYALNYIFAIDSVWLILLTFVVMITVGAQAASGRVKVVESAFAITFSSMFIGSMISIGLMLLLEIIAFEAKYIIPLGGMIIGNSMNSSALTVERISSDILGNRTAIETSLSLGKSWRVAVKPFIKKAATAGMLSMLNSMKTIGLVALPGAMTGMILAGADPLDAVLLQIIVMNMLLFAVALTSVIAVELTVRRYFSKAHQLKQNG